MIKSKRTKRRKINEELNDIQRTYLIKDTSPDINTSLEYEVISSDCTNIVELPLTSKTSCSNDIQGPSTCFTSSIELPPVNSSNEALENDDVIQQEYTSFKEELSTWAIECNVPQSSMNKLLKILKIRQNINTVDLPWDCRTLLATPQSLTANIRSVIPGNYYHFGLAEGIKRYASHNLNEIKIAIGIDGLPLAKSSNSQLWPILAFIVDNDSSKTVFPVGVYHGNTKPKDSDDFLADFVSESKDLLMNGIVLNNTVKKVSIHVIVCDSPAKAFILKIKGHSGFYSCTRCTQEGLYYKNRVCFPYSKDKATERTHEAYINMLNEEHHVGNKLSILVELTGIDSVRTFSLDYLHLVCLGAVRKLILLWLSKGPLSVRLPTRDVHKLTKSLLDIKSFIPSDFARKTREIQEIGRWKATELRLFLLYIGPIVLKNITKADVFTNFMCLHVAMLILLSPDRQCHWAYAKELLDYFVSTFEIIYGCEHISHNIHGLLHLAEDYNYFGPLDNSSAFAFESYMKELKSKVRKHDKPLEQLINRYTEIYNQVLINLPANHKQHEMLSHPHSNGPLVDNLKGIQYRQLILNKIKINTSTDKESYFLTHNEEVVQCLNIVNCQNNAIILIGKIFKKISMLYDEPVDSTIFDIFIVKDLSNNLKSWKFSEIKKKMMIVVHNGLSIAMPIIHS